MSTLLIHPDDHVVVALQDLAIGAAIDGGIVTRAKIPYLHKLSRRRLNKGDPVYKFGQPIGLATEVIEPGDWVHTHNLGMGDFSGNYQFSTETPPAPTPVDGGTFMGYPRKDGRVGIRNLIAVVSSVNCSATVSRMVVEQFPKELLAQFPNVDGLIALTHADGCGLVTGNSDHEMLQRTLAGLAKNPNIGGYIIIGLGCEAGHPKYMAEGGLIQITNLIGDGRTGLPVPTDSSGPLMISLQSHKGTPNTIAVATQALKRLLPEVNAIKRVPCSVSLLKVALNCGGSDAASGLTANPALGYASDMLVARGGTIILAETPETYGAEALLVRRAISRAVGEKLIERILWWRDVYVPMFGAVLKHPPTLDANPSEGNKRNGITTILEKSLGAVTKAGTTALRAVYLYGEQILESGFVFMDTPGTDWTSMTGLAAGGAQVAVFTTGNGSCLGYQIMPTIKVASNTPMYERMLEDMDLNAGGILTGQAVAEVGQQIYDEIIATASGKKTRSELLGYGNNEVLPWKIGPQM